MLKNIIRSRKTILPNNNILPSLFHNNNATQFSTISQWMRKFMNRIRFQDNRAIQSRQDKFQIQVLQTPKQVQQNFVDQQQIKSVAQRQRMKRLDQILGTKTYFHQTKVFQQRVDSDHVMRIEQLQKKYRQLPRSVLNWENPQAKMNVKVKSSRKYFRNMKNLRQYPKHNQRITDFKQQKSQQNIQFLGKQSLYSKLSLKWVDTYQKSIQSQTVQDKELQFYSHRYSQSYVYFSVSYHPGVLFRLPQHKYTTKLLNSVQQMKLVQNQLQQVVSLDELYEALKQQYHDQRVSQWLKKVQNGQITYLISGFKTSKNEDKIIFWIDLLGNKKEFVFLFKNLKLGNKKYVSITNDEHSQIQKHKTSEQTNIVSLNKSNLIFNCQPEAIFSQNGESIYLIQRSQQGGFVQLVRVQINQGQRLKQPQVIYKCKSYENMEIFTDQNNNYLFVRITQVGEKYKGQNIYILQQGQKIGDNEDEEGTLELIKIIGSQVQQNTKDSNDQLVKLPLRRTAIQWCSKGLILTEFSPSESQFFKYGSHLQYATKVQLIPYKTHIQLLQQSQKQTSSIQYQLLASQKSQKTHISAKQLDIFKRQTLFQCGQQQFISQISVRQTHLIIILSTKSIYNKKRIFFNPYQKSKNPHSLVFNVQKLNFINFGYNFSSQQINFSLNRSVIFSQYFQYIIWKKQLKQLTNDNIYIEKVKINQNIEVTITCLKKFLDHLPKFYRDEQEQDNTENEKNELAKKESKYKLQNTQVPILIYLKDHRQADYEMNNSYKKSLIKKSQLNIRKFLQKGTLLINISCRGTLDNDLVKFHQGSGQNFQSMLSDIQQSIQWIGNNLGSNISIYTKGYISGLVGMLLNIKHPFLFTSSVLHNGVYDFLNKNVYHKGVEYFFRLEEAQLEKEQNKQKLMFWKTFNTASFGFKRTLMPKSTQRDQIQQADNENQVQRQKVNFENQQLSLQKQNNDESNVQLNTQSLKNSLVNVAVKKAPKIGTLQNVLICCDSDDYNKIQARQFIYKLRKNVNFRYQEVYLKQFLDQQDIQLFNLSYIFGKMKERLEYDSKN